MAIIQPLSMDFALRGIPQRVVGKQDDSGGLRRVSISLTSNGVPYVLASGTEFMIRYKTAQGAIGLYDTLPDGTSPFLFTPGTNYITVSLVDQIFAQPGDVECELRIIEPAGSVSTWTWIVEVERSNSGDATIPSDYINVIAGYAAAAAASAEEAKQAAAGASFPITTEMSITVENENWSNIYYAKAVFWGEFLFVSFCFYTMLTAMSASVDFTITIPIPSGYRLTQSPFDGPATDSGYFSGITVMSSIYSSGTFELSASMYPPDMASNTHTIAYSAMVPVARTS